MTEAQTSAITLASAISQRHCRSRMSNLYQAISVWRRVNATTSVRYVCFENISQNGYCVLAADFFNLPLDPRLQACQDRNLIELLTEEDLSERCKWFSTLQEAVERHDRDFQSTWDS
jgi:hypothetical protein